MSTKELLQENQYNFPYHYLSHERDGGIFIFKHLFWGLEHFTYINFVIDEIKKYEHKSLTDIGCGEGRIISEIKSFIHADNLRGYDVSESALGFARGFIPDVKFSLHDITVSPTSDKFDTIVSCEVIEHIKPEKVDLYCKNIAESLKSGGLFFITTPTTNIPVNKKHYQHFTKELLTKHLEPYFIIEEVFYLNKVNFFSRLLNRMIANRYFLSNSKTLNRWVLKQYRKYFLHGESHTGSRIYMKCVKI